MVLNAHPPPSTTRTRWRRSVLVVGGLIASVGLVLLALVAFARQVDRTDGVTVMNTTSEQLALHRYSIGDGPETVSSIVELPPHKEATVDCSFMRGWAVVDASGMWLDIVVPCPRGGGREMLVVTTGDLPD